MCRARLRLVGAAMLVAVAATAWAQIPPHTLVTLWAFGTIDGPGTVYLIPNGGSDPAEAAAVIPVRMGMTFQHLTCWLDGSSGSATVTVTGRTGTCGTLSDAAFACTIGTGQQTCDSGAALFPVAPTKCLTFKVVISGALPAPRHLGCSVERIT